MKAFAALYRQLDASSRTAHKEAALEAFFAKATAADAAWALWLLCGERLPQPIPTRVLKATAIKACGIDPDLFADCYETVGDLAETIALLLPDGGADDQWPLQRWINERIQPLRGRSETEQAGALVDLWQRVDRTDAFVLNKLLTGGLRVGVSRGLALRGLARACGQPVEVLAARMAGGWQPGVAQWQSLVAPDADGPVEAQPYPFRLAHPLDAAPETLGLARDWLAEWKWDGIRGQIVRRADAHLWSRGDENLDAGFPDLLAGARGLPAGTVLDGEILVRQLPGANPLPAADPPALPSVCLPPVALAPFSALQRRLGRKAPGRALLASHPAVFLAFDLLELDGTDWRQRPLGERRAALERVLAANAAATAGRCLAAPVLPAADWQETEALRTLARAVGAEGLMLKRASSAYGTGRTRGDWWKWKLEPYSVDAVMVYAQAGHGRRAGLFTDYTFAVWHDGALVPFAKAYSGLTDAEIREVDRFVRRHTLASFGPVRQVEPDLVFEIGFEGILASTRHKAGLAVRFPRMLRWRRDKAAADADTLAQLRVLAGISDS